MNHISIRGARTHNLKNIDVDIPRNSFVVITGLSGSGKSSLAFDTIYAEGQRRYVESLSLYARQFLDVLEKPDVDQIEGLPPAIAIDQKSSARNPRSTVGTMTNIYDYLRIIFARAGRPHCPNCSLALIKKTTDQITEDILSKKSGNTIHLLAPVVQKSFGSYEGVFEDLKKSGYRKVRVDGVWYSILDAQELSLSRKEFHSIDVVVCTYKISQNNSFTGVQRKYLKEHILKCLDLGDGILFVYDDLEQRDYIYSWKYICPECDFFLPELEPRHFSFNSPLGACSGCGGLGVRMEVNRDLLTPNKKLSLSEGAIQPWFKVFANQKAAWNALYLASKKHRFSLHTPLRNTKKEHLDIIFNGDGQDFLGIIPMLEKKFKDGTSEYIKKEISKYVQEFLCRDCDGYRLKKEYLCVTIAGLSISEVAQMDIKSLRKFVAFCLGTVKNNNNDWKKLTKKQRDITSRAFAAIDSRLVNVQDVGLSYLTLDRAATTLSGGEAQRLRLSIQLASELVGIVYILDEPSIGLHPRDITALIKTLKRLRDQGNSVIVVEHDKNIIESADYIIDIGPGAGAYGGRVIAQGTNKEIRKNQRSLTGKYLSGSLKIDPPKEIRKGSSKNLIIEGASAHNLKNISVKFPLGRFIAISGVSGSGKSTLIVDILARVLAKHFYHAKEPPKEHKKVKGIEYIDKVITIDQSPIGRTPRSNPATYTGLFNYIRDFFTQIPAAKLKGLKAGNFSFNVKEGRCEECSGEGMVKVDMQFLSDIYIECKACHGDRYNSKSLAIHYNGKNIADILRMSVMEAMWFFGGEKVPMIYEKLRVLTEVGLGYIRLGQSATTLSGGEAQRIKLATELSRRSTGKTLYILDEPTTGLHLQDIKHLLKLLQKLVDKGNTIIMIEHNIDVIKCADWVIDLGPGGGNEGGTIVGVGTPQEIARNKKSETGKFLRKVL